ncbi:E3 ubiquitin-protein ligase HECTD3 [Geodia barretti]|uniref:E3 ubiquitin-protein ligase HECTD3 n=1 Tax=Geodia barretti TaxID=519541 RepID=A0AA35RC87_GEOBA|nr:E3 ubiquitin-protein ligase HECTD3 [Geodia barretti]
MCPLQIVSVPSLKNQDEDAMATLQTPPPGWNMEADEELAQFLVTKWGGVEDLTYLLPSWEVGLEGAKSEVTEAVSAIRQLWPMSRRRNALISDMLSATATSAPSRPTVYIDRMSAKRHQENPSEDKEGKRTVFIQLSERA